MLIAIAIFVIFVIVIIGLILFALVFILAIPFYFLKKGPTSEEGTYRIEDVRSIKEDEKK